MKRFRFALYIILCLAIALVGGLLQPETLFACRVR